VTMTKRKKWILISGIALILVVAILFSLFWFVWRDEEPEEPEVVVPVVDTSTLFAMPDEMVFIKDGKETAVSPAQMSEILADLVWLEENVVEFDSINGEFTESRTSEYMARFLCVKLRYGQRYRYTGEMGPFLNMEYDTLLVCLGDRPGWIIPYRDGAYQAVGRSYWMMVHYDPYDYDNPIKPQDRPLVKEATAVTAHIKSFYTP